MNLLKNLAPTPSPGGMREEDMIKKSKPKLMKITLKQHEEIDWLAKHFVTKGIVVTDAHKQDYIQVSVYGEGSGKVDVGGKGTQNPLLIAKRSLDMNIKMWRQDIGNGLFAIWEFEEDEFMQGYGEKIFRSIMLNLPKQTPGEGYFRTSSILWANEKWGLKIKCDTGLEDYNNLKKVTKQIDKP